MSASESGGSSETVIALNVGGQVFTTTLSTLRIDDNSRMYDIFGTKNIENMTHVSFVVNMDTEQIQKQTYSNVVQTRISGNKSCKSKKKS